MSFSVPVLRERRFFVLIRRALKRANVARKIPADIYELVDRIHARFSAMTVSRDALNDKRCALLDRMIGALETDPDLLNLQGRIGDFSVISRIFPDSPSAGWGDNLIYTAEGLQLYIWNDYSGERRTIKAQSASIPYALTADGLRNEIVLRTSRTSFVAWVAEHHVIAKMGDR